MSTATAPSPLDGQSRGGKSPCPQTKQSNSRWKVVAGKKIDIWDVNILTQARRTFDGLVPLAESLTKIVIHHPCIAVLEPPEAVEYIAYLSMLWKVNIYLDDLKTVTLQGKKYYLILISGNRRILSVRTHLWEQGCSHCQALAQKKGRAIEPGECYRRHFRQGFPVTFHFHIPVEEALDIQMAENTGVRVPTTQEAEAYANLWLIRTMSNPNLTLKEFSGDMGRCPETIRNALRFVGSSPEVQEAVLSGVIPYTSGVQLGRVQQALGLSNEEVNLEWLGPVIAHKTTPYRLTCQVSQRINAVKGQQKDLAFAAPIDSSREVEKAAATQLQAASSSAGWTIDKITFMVQHGLIQKSPFLQRVALAAFRNFVIRLHNLLPHLEFLVSEAEAREATKVVERTLDLTNRLEELLPAEHQMGSGQLLTLQDTVKPQIPDPALAPDKESKRRTARAAKG